MGGVNCRCYFRIDIFGLLNGISSASTLHEDYYLQIVVTSGLLGSRLNAPGTEEI